MEKNRIRALQLGDTTRMSYSKINEVLEMPNLIEVQKNSYQAASSNREPYRWP